MGQAGSWVMRVATMIMVCTGLLLLPVGGDVEASEKKKREKINHKRLAKDHKKLYYGIESLAGDHVMVKESLDAVEGNQDKTHEWLEKIETAIGELAPGAAAPLCGAGTEGQRFVADGTEVCDNDTGLYWVKAPDATPRNHATALTHCAGLNLGNSQTYRLPEVKELISLVDYSQFNPALPAGHPFSGVQSSFYWSASTSAIIPADAWIVNFGNGFVFTSFKTDSFFVWCARSGS